MSGYIKIDRKILEWEWYKNINTKILFLHMLLKANWKDGKFEGKLIPRGSFVSSIPKLALENDLTINEVRTALKHLKETGEITVKSHSKYSVYTVTNYTLYQCDSQADNSQLTGSPQADNSQSTGKSQSINSLLTTIEEDKEYKAGNKEKKEEGKNKKEKGTNVPKEKKAQEPYFIDELLNQAFLDFIDMRKQIKKPMTNRAVTIAQNKLRELAGNDSELMVRILEQSTMNCWQGLFPLKEEKKTGSRNVFDEWRNA